MAMEALDLPDPSSDYPFWLDPQQRFLESLDLAAVPLVREVSHGQPKALSPSQVKVVYVSRQETDRKLDERSELGLQTALHKLAGESFRRKDGQATHVLVEIVRFEHMAVREQMEVVHDADVSHPSAASIGQRYSPDDICVV
jgi:hypothetical protein